tara:strand:- start:255 stop:629 length:375 start_codon:yes stop_codon:yes gene_type:complete
MFSVGYTEVRQRLLRKGLLQELFCYIDTACSSKSNSTHLTSGYANPTTPDVETLQVRDSNIAYHGLFSCSKRSTYNTCTCSGMTLAFTAAGLSLFVCYLLTKTNTFVDLRHCDFGYNPLNLAKR